MYAYMYLTYVPPPSHMYAGILANYPKRVDIWSIYIDMELRQGEAEPIRRVFERATSLRLSSKKMKFFFSR